MVMDASVILPSKRPQFLCEKMIGVDAHEPLARLASMGHVVRGEGANEAGSKFHDLDGRTVGEHLMQEGSVQRARRLTVSKPGYYSDQRVFGFESKLGFWVGLGSAVRVEGTRGGVQVAVLYWGEHFMEEGSVKRARQLTVNRTG